MGITSIQWTERTWNPTRGCSRVSEGCRNCYAERMAARFSHVDNVTSVPGVFHKYAEQTPAGPRWTGEVKLIPSMLDIPLRRKKPTTYFVNSMSDLFHEALPDEAIDQVFAVMALCQQHTFQVLTKRAQRMLYVMTKVIRTQKFWPMHNVWLGVSVEDQRTADERIPLLLQTPAAGRFVSYEPALDGIDIEGYLRPCDDDLARDVDLPRGWDRGIDWLICGGESGPGARPFDLVWARSVRDQCKAARVAFFFKQGGASNRCKHDAKGGCLDCIPADLQIREYPLAT